jgi:hypothetical protein
MTDTEEFTRPLKSILGGGGVQRLIEKVVLARGKEGKRTY